MTPPTGPASGESRWASRRRALRSVLESFAESGFILWGFGTTLETSAWAGTTRPASPAALLPAPRRSSDVWPSTK